MAMTKKEKALLEAAQYETALAKSLKWCENVEPDLSIDTGSLLTTDNKKYIVGWTIIGSEEFRRVEKAWSESNRHGIGDYPFDKDQYLASARSIMLYSKESDALKALRFQIMLSAAKRLAELDERIKRLESES